MPANPKYLTRSKAQRFAKILAAFPLAYLLSASIHMALACWFDQRTVVSTMTFSLFVLWAVLMFVPFILKNGWKCCALFLVLSFLLLLLANSGSCDFGFLWN